MLVSAQPHNVTGFDFFIPKMIQPGVFQLTSFNGQMHFPEFAPAEFDRSEFGVADTVEQIVNHYPEVNSPDRAFIITVTEVRREHQESEGGWRWRKWGPYIGTHKPQCEYLYDEQGIDRVLVYEVMECVWPSTKRKLLNAV